MRIDILTLFPEMFPAVLGASILGRASEGGLASYHLHDIRDYAENKHDRVDDRPFGGGPGMVMMCQPLHDCVQAVERKDQTPATRILLTPQGEPLRQERIEALATKPRLLLIAGHYEGVDERVIDELQPLELSVGDYVLSGGELPAMIVLDAVVRLIPGVLGHEDSASEDSFGLRDIGSDSAPGQTRTLRRLLDCPHYTRPRVWNDRAVPDVLLSGDHGAIAEWRKEQMIERTRERRPDLMNQRDPRTGASRAAGPEER
ncbi:MAG: tRNA (guanosine(37)-N1)-methyltransferase TrmD [Planctomycetota bacterium]|jgi:tRNA (guanine37-N1)-methyltransferase